LGKPAAGAVQADALRIAALAKAERCSGRPSAAAALSLSPSSIVVPVMVTQLSGNSTEARHVLVTTTAQETQACARWLAGRLQVGDFLALCGDLGSGKTCFVQGLADGLRVEGRVSSPSFVLLHYHPGPLPLLHLDAYRVRSSAEFRDLGMDDYARTCVIALEWADRVPDLWPREVLAINFTYANAGRRLEFVGRGARPSALVEELSRRDPGH